ncbi:flavin reductase family protein [Thermopolyspora sp. NPDC052614]|uniref:flavin reductase family protein n=1 Tax=Thermopolyspora sp. NPDC052614 TaxID=3155682 RepID=UPI00343DE4D6
MIEIEVFNQDPKRLRQAFGCFPSGVVALAAMDGDEPVGMAIASFTPVSLAPPLVSVCVQNTSRTWPRLRGRTRVGLSVLAEGHDDVALRLSSKEGDRFAGVDWEATSDGSVFVHGATAVLNCRVYGEIPAGDHVMVLLEVLGLGAQPDGAPLVFHGSRFRSLAAGAKAA